MVKEKVGGHLLSHTVTSAVPSALAGLTAGFGKGPGVPPPHEPPTHSQDKIAGLLGPPHIAAKRTHQ